MFTASDFIADQLRVSTPGVEWRLAGIDRARELAGMLARAGVVSLHDLLIAPVTYTQDVQIPTGSGDAWDGEFINDSWQIKTYRFNNHGHFLGYLGEADSAANALPGFKVFDRGYLVAWSAAGHGNVSYFLRFNAGGFSVIPVWGSSSDLGDVRAALRVAAVFVLSFVFPAAGVSIGAEVGAAIIGPELAAAYPGLAAAVGNAAISTALNGGDIAAAARSSFAGYVGLNVGAGVAGETGLELVGAVAKSATTALISGRGINDAVSSVLVNAGFNSISEVFAMPINTDDYGGPDYDWREIDDAATEDPMTRLDVLPPVLPPWDTDPLNPVSIPEIVITPGGGNGWKPSDVMSAALALVRAYRGVAPANTPRANGQGVIVQRTTTGALATTRPAVGVAIPTADGGAVINNGDNTYTLIRADGARSVRPYSSGVSANTMLIAGGALLAFLALR